MSTFTPMGLPSKWDGIDVEWRAWQRTDTTTLEHAGPRSRHGKGREPCERCRSLAAPMMNSGRAATGPDWVGPRVFRLFAFRCPNCHLDTVWDMNADHWWTLDESDYGPQGSTDPRLPEEGTMPIPARALWFDAPERCTCPADWDAEELALGCQHRVIGGWMPAVWRGSIRPDGRLIITDQLIALYADEVTGLEEMPPPRLLSRKQVLHLAPLLLAAHVVDEPPPRRFRALYLDLLEPAGYRVRALQGEDTHAVVSDRGVVGLIMPTHRDAQPRPTDRVVAA